MERSVLHETESLIGNWHRSDAAFSGSGTKEMCFTATRAAPLNTDLIPLWLVVRKVLIFSPSLPFAWKTEPLVSRSCLFPPLLIHHFLASVFIRSEFAETLHPPASPCQGVKKWLVKKKKKIIMCWQELKEQQLCIRWECKILASPVSQHQLEKDI